MENKWGWILGIWLLATPAFAQPTHVSNEGTDGSSPSPLRTQCQQLIQTWNRPQVELLVSKELQILRVPLPTAFPAGQHLFAHDGEDVGKLVYRFENSRVLVSEFQLDIKTLLKKNFDKNELTERQIRREVLYQEILYLEHLLRKNFNTVTIEWDILKGDQEEIADLVSFGFAPTSLGTSRVRIERTRSFRLSPILARHDRALVKDRPKAPFQEDTLLLHQAALSQAPMVFPAHMVGIPSSSFLAYPFPPSPIERLGNQLMQTTSEGFYFKAFTSGCTGVMGGLWTDEGAEITFFLTELDSKPQDTLVVRNALYQSLREQLLRPDSQLETPKILVREKDLATQTYLRDIAHLRTAPDPMQYLELQLADHETGIVFILEETP